MGLSPYREDHFWSVTEGGPAVRVAIFDERGREHAKIVPWVKGWVKRREEVIGELEQGLDHRP